MRSKLIGLDKEQIIRLHQQGQSPGKIAKAFELEYKVIYRYLIKTRTYINRDPQCFMRKYHVNNNFFDKIDTESKAYWLGLFVADGCVDRRRGSISITLHMRDTKHLQQLSKDLDSNHPIKLNEKDQCNRITIDSKQLKIALANHGVYPNKTFNINWPTGIPFTLEKHFIRGVFDGDGSFYIDKNNQVEFSITGNESFLDTIQNKLVVACDLNKTKFRRRERTKAVNLCYVGNRQVRRIFSYLWDNTTLYLPRKYNKVHDVLFPVSS